MKETPPLPVNVEPLDSEERFVGAKRTPRKASGSPASYTAEASGTSAAAAVAPRTSGTSTSAAEKSVSARAGFARIKNMVKPIHGRPSLREPALPDSASFQVLAYSMLGVIQS